MAIINENFKTTLLKPLDGKNILKKVSNIKSSSYSYAGQIIYIEENQSFIIVTEADDLGTILNWEYLNLSNVGKDPNNKSIVRISLDDYKSRVNGTLVNQIHPNVIYIVEGLGTFIGEVPTFKTSNIIYVDPDYDGKRRIPGISWDLPTTNSLQDAVEFVNESQQPFQIYLKSSSYEITKTLQIKSGTTIKGGFGGKSIIKCSDQTAINIQTPQKVVLEGLTITGKYQEAKKTWSLNSQVPEGTEVTNIESIVDEIVETLSPGYYKTPDDNIYLVEFQKYTPTAGGVMVENNSQCVLINACHFKDCQTVEGAAAVMGPLKRITNSLFTGNQIIFGSPDCYSNETPSTKGQIIQLSLDTYVSGNTFVGSPSDEGLAISSELYSTSQIYFYNNIIQTTIPSPIEFKIGSDVKYNIIQNDETYSQYNEIITTSVLSEQYKINNKDLSRVGRIELIKPKTDLDGVLRKNYQIAPGCYNYDEEQQILVTTDMLDEKLNNLKFNGLRWSDIDKL